MYGPKWPFLLMYGSHNMKHRFSTGLRVVNGPPRFGVSHDYLYNSLKEF